MRYPQLLLLVLLCAFPLGAISQDHAVDPKAELVLQFLAAFNAQDAARMGEMISEDVKWLSVENGTTAIEVEGKSELVSAMEEYFDSCPTCRSIITSIMPSQDRVSVVELASWQVNGTTKSQQSMAIYEFAGSKVAAVYYFPPESVSTTH